MPNFPRVVNLDSYSQCKLPIRRSEDLEYQPRYSDSVSRQIWSQYFPALKKHLRYEVDISTVGIVLTVASSGLMVAVSGSQWMRGGKCHREQFRSSGRYCGFLVEGTGNSRFRRGGTSVLRIGISRESVVAGSAALDSCDWSRERF